MFGEYALELRLVWNPKDGWYVQSYVVSGVDGPFSDGEIVRMQTLRPKPAGDIAGAVECQGDELEVAMAEVRLTHGVQPRLL